MNSRYEIINLLGKGRTGGVYIAGCTQSTDTAAMRRFFFHKSSDDSAWTRAFSRLPHDLLYHHAPHLLRNMETGFDEDGPYIVSELLQGQTLAQRIHDNHPFSAHEIYQIAAELTTSLSALHSAGYYHGSVGANSIYLANSPHGGFTVKLLDFGLHHLCSLLAEELGEPNCFRETAMTAPEVLKGAPMSFQADLYSLGHLLYSSWLHGHPYVGMQPEEIILLADAENSLTATSEIRPFPPKWDCWLNALMHTDVTKRTPNARHALSHLPSPQITRLGQFSVQDKSKTAAITKGQVAVPQLATRVRKKSFVPIAIACLAIISLGGILFTANYRAPKKTPAANPTMMDEKPSPPVAYPDPPSDPFEEAIEHVAPQSL